LFKLLISLDLSISHVGCLCSRLIYVCTWFIGFKTEMILNNYIILQMNELKINDSGNIRTNVRLYNRYAQ